jgi:hypothetical protein
LRNFHSIRTLGKFRKGGEGADAGGQSELTCDAAHAADLTVR